MNTRLTSLRFPRLTMPAGSMMVAQQALVVARFFDIEKVLKKHGIRAGYSKAIGRIGYLKSCTEIGDDINRGGASLRVRLNEVVAVHSGMTAVTGAVGGLGGRYALPLLVGSEIATVCFQVRMLAIGARIVGLDPESDEIKALAEVLLIGNSVVSVRRGARATAVGIVKEAGKHGVKLAKWMPVLGGLIGSACSFYDTRVLGTAMIEHLLAHHIQHARPPIQHARRPTPIRHLATLPRSSTPAAVRTRALRASGFRLRTRRASRGGGTAGGDR